MAIFQNKNTLTATFVQEPLVHTIEETNALTSVPTSIILTDPVLNDYVADFVADLATITGTSAAAKEQLKTFISTYSLNIFTQAVTNNQLTTGYLYQDDRPLYWVRNKMISKLKDFMNAHPDLIDESLITLFERRSRGYDTIDFSSLPAGTKKVLITGFDPFQLDRNINQGNPSGASALFMHGKTLTGGSNTAKIQCAVVPVRYADFDNGTIEGLIDPYLNGPEKVDMMVTISQGRPLYYDVERFAAKYRDPTSTDNLDVEGNTATFYIPTSTGLGPIAPDTLPEFLETTLPFAQMVPGTNGNFFTVFNQKWETTNGHRSPSNHLDGAVKSLPEPPAGSISRQGSGSNYLSNEIFYRVALLRTKHESTTLTGHLHVPALQGGGQPYGYISTTTLVNDVQKMIMDAISAL